MRRMQFRASYFEYLRAGGISGEHCARRGLLWTIHVRDLSTFFWAVPMWFAVLFVIVRIAPHVVPPRLELHDFGPFTTLDLQHESKKMG